MLSTQAMIPSCVKVCIDAHVLRASVSSSLSTGSTDMGSGCCIVLVDSTLGGDTYSSCTFGGCTPTLRVSLYCFACCKKIVSNFAKYLRELPSSVVGMLPFNASVSYFAAFTMASAGVTVGFVMCLFL